MKDPHSMGTIWASILFEVYWGLVQQHGFSSNWMDSQQKEGNIVMIRLLIAGMQFQPCNPVFVSARSAILLADEISANPQSGQDGFDIPAECK